MSELDLLVVQGNQRFGFEFKRSDAPKVTKSMRIVLDDLRLRRIDVVYPGPKTFDIDKRVRAVALMDVPWLAGWK
jgi:hypothetical protein